MGAELLIIDDHPLFADGFALMVGQLRPNWILRRAATGGEALAVLALRRPSAAILDVGLPDRDGFDLMHDIAARWPDLPTILISGRDHAAMGVRARASRAQGFIPKSAPAARFVAMIETVLAGGEAFGNGGGQPADLPVLTGRQAEILDLLAEGHGNKEIRHRLGIAERTVRAHLTDLFNLLGVHSRMQAIIRARELGLIE
jgi:DNA-binding NarL/FixJ family response regulator